MSTVNYFSAVLPSQGIKFVLIIHADGRKVQRDYHPHEHSDMMSFMRWGLSKRANVYVSQSGFCLGDDGQAKRLAANAQWQRSLWLDMDCGAGKPYATQRDALSALAVFCRATKMPNPWVINSGAGLHVYWPFTQDVPTAQWSVLSGQLRAACEAHGLQADLQCTTDAARVLRPPGTANVNGPVPKAVAVLAQPAATDVARMGELLAGYTATHPARVAVRDTSALSANLHPPYWMKGVITQCPGMKAMFLNAGAHAQEPLWKVTLDMVNQSADSEAVKLAAIHALSKGHPGFTQDALDAKWDQVKAQDYNPPTCSTMQGAGMPQCAGCMFRGSITSPVMLGRAEFAAPVAPPQPTVAAVGNTVAQPTPSVAPIQAGVFVFDHGSDIVRVVNGAISKRVAIKDGFPSVLVEKADATSWWAPLFSYKLLSVRRMIDRVHQQMIVALTFDCATDMEVTVELTGKDFSDPAALVSKLTNGGMHVTKASVSKFQEVFMTEFLTQLQRARAASRIASRCGWTNDMKGFVLGSTLYKKGGTEHTRPADGASEMEAYIATGDRGAWKQAFLTTMSGGRERQAVLGLAIGAPLMQFTGVSGLMLNAYSPESGVGKSTLCDAALSIWGSPGRLRHSANDTVNARYKLATILGNLPMVVDEFTNVEGRELSDYIYTITQGREKHRLTSDAKLNGSPGNWCLPTIVTSNRSMHDKLQEYRSDATAEAARVFELRIAPLTPSQSNLGNTKAILRQLTNNFGFLGPDVAALLLSKPVEYWQQLVSSRIAWWDKNVAMDAGDRFRVACAVLTELGASIGVVLGLPFDVPGIRAELIRQWTEQRDELESAQRKPLDFVVGYITDHLSDMAVFGGKDGDMLLAQMPRRVAGEIRGASVNNRYVPSEVIVPLDQFRSYVRKANGNFKAVQEWLKDEALRTGHVTQIGRMAYLRGQPQQIMTRAIEFSTMVLGNAKLSGITSPPPPAPVLTAIHRHRGVGA